LRPKMEIGWKICQPDIWVFALQPEVLQGWLEDLANKNTHYIALSTL